MTRIAVLGLLFLIGAAPGRGRVVDATRGRAFLDVGSADGLRSGAKVRIGKKSKKGKFIWCRVDQLAEHFASCPVQGARVGQRVRFRARRRSEQESPPPRIVAPGADPKAVSAALSTAPVAQVIHEAQPTLTLGWRAEAALTQRSWVRSTGSFHRQQVDAVVDAPVGFLESRATVDLTVLGWAARPDGARFRSDERAVLYVHETSVNRRHHDGGLTLAVGRIRPWFAPGIAYLDGAQAGYRLSDHAEIGGLGGLLPDVITLEPDADHWTAGVYGQYRAGRTHRFSLQGRVGAVARPDVVSGEAETQLGYRYGPHLTVRGAVRAAVERGRVEASSVRGAISARPWRWLEVDLQGRMRDERPDPGAPEWTVVGADHARAAAWFRVARGLRLGAVGQTSHLRGDDEWRHGAGPQVGWRVMRGFSLLAGYQEAFGWLPGRTGWAQANLRLSPRVRLSVRSSYVADAVGDDTVQSAGGYTLIDWRTPWAFDVRMSGLFRVPVAGRDDLGAAWVARVTMIGRL